MTTEITRKQAILLAVLGVLLVIICYVQFLIRPMFTEVSATKEQIQTLEDQYEALVTQSKSYDQNIASLEEWKTANSEETTRLFPLSHSDRIDRFLTFVISECGATVTSLSISDTLEYYVDAENNLVLAPPDMETTAAGGTDAAAATTTEAGTEGEAPAAAYTATGEYTCDLTYSLEGNYADMIQFVNYVNRVSFLGISEYTFESVSEDNTQSALQDSYSFTLTITAYMYEDPLKSDEAETTEEAGTEETTETTEISE